ncbi:MAG TPA: TonB-dependent receptor [Polyangia bacterium]|nr:TonB-dependent receptor [Polyangia bacterium]
MPPSSAPAPKQPTVPAPRRIALAAAMVVAAAFGSSARAAEDAGAGDAGAAPAVEAAPPPEAGDAAPPSASAPADNPAFRTTVSAAPPAPTLPREDRAAAASVVLPAESPRAYDDLGSLLVQVPGVTVTRTGASQAFTSLTLRGSTPDQVQIYVDGVPLDIAEGGGVDVSTLPLGDVERVEVYRGTSPLAFGEAALGGIISITTRTPGLPRASARAGVGSFGTAFGDASGGGRVGRLRLYLGAHVYATKGDYPFQYNPTPLNPDTGIETVRQNNDALEGNGVLRAVLSLAGRRTLALGLVGFARAEGLPGPTNQLAFHTRFHTARGLGTLRYESRDDLGPGGRLSAEAFVSVERDRLLDPDAEIQKSPQFFFHDTTLSIGTTVHATRPLSDWGRAAAILEARRETYTPDDETDAADSGLPARRLLGVAGAELTFYLHRLDLEVTPSARIEGMDDTVTGLNTNDQPLPAGPAVARLLPTYRLGVVRPLSPVVTLKANVGEYHHAPSFLELYGDGTHRLLGNPGLVPESGANADVALWIDRPGARVSAASRTTLFGTLADDLIYWQLTSAGPSRAENLSRARVYGLEQELQLGLGRHARVVAQATYLVAEDESDNPTTRGKQIPHHPRWSGYARPEAVRLGLPHGLELGAYVDGAVLAGGYDDPARLFSIPAAVLVGAGASLSRPRSGLRLTVSALNLTDLTAWNVSYWPLPGRTVFVSLAYDSASAEDAGAAGLQSFGPL